MNRVKTDADMLLRAKRDKKSKELRRPVAKSKMRQEE